MGKRKRELLTTGKKFYGRITLKERNFTEADSKRKMELEYYVTKEKEKYGVEIIKKDYRNEQMKVETCIEKAITESKEEIEKLINILKNNIVTPIGLKDVMCDYRV